MFLQSQHDKITSHFCMKTGGKPPTLLLAESPKMPNFSILSLIVALVILIIFSFRAVRIKQGQFSRKVSESPSAL